MPQDLREDFRPAWAERLGGSAVEPHALVAPTPVSAGLLGVAVGLGKGRCPHTRLGRTEWRACARGGIMLPPHPPGPDAGHGPHRHRACRCPHTRLGRTANVPVPVPVTSLPPHPPGPDGGSARG